MGDEFVTPRPCRLFAEKNDGQSRPVRQFAKFTDRGNAMLHLVGLLHQPYPYLAGCVSPVSERKRAIKFTFSSSLNLRG